ncbi:unnamed protein product, partial [marine sediment metagenome]
CENGVQPVVFRAPILPDEIWAGTKAAGMYRTLNFSDFDYLTGAQPKWDTVNEGLGDYLSIFTLHLDPFNESGRQYCLAGREEEDWWWDRFRGPIFRREEPNDWEIILDFDDVQTLTSQSDTEIFDVCLDPENEDYVYALAVSANSRSMYLLKSVDGGDIWTLHDTVVTWWKFYYDELFEDFVWRYRLAVKGDEFLINGMHFYEYGAGQNDDTDGGWYSSNGGTVWGLSAKSYWWANDHSGVFIGTDDQYFPGDWGATTVSIRDLDSDFDPPHLENYAPV